MRFDRARTRGSAPALKEREAFLTPEAAAQLRADRERKVGESASTPDEDFVRRVAEVGGFTGWSPDVPEQLLDRFPAPAVSAVDTVLARFMESGPTEDQVIQMVLACSTRLSSPVARGTAQSPEFPWAGELQPSAGRG